MANREITVLLFLRRVDCNDGVASYCETIIRGLKAQGVRVVIVSGPVTQLYGSSSRYEFIKENVLEWIEISDLSATKPRLSTIRVILAAIRRHAVDVISPQGFSLVALSFLLKRLTRKPVVANYHPSMTGRSPQTILTNRTTKMNLGYRFIATFFTADRFIAISKDIEAFYLRDCGIAKERIVYIPLGIDMTAFRPPSLQERQEARAKLAIPDDALVCILPGRLNFDKGQDIAIDATRIVRENNPSLKLICLFPGGGDQEREIHEYAFRSDADRASFKFLGFVDATTFRQAFWAADIGLLPSRFEGFGLVVAEAMSCGCVPIRTPSGGCDDQIVDGSNGYVVPFNDPAALADRISRLFDAAHRAVLRKNALQFAADHFNESVMVTKTANVYRSAVAGADPA